MQPPVFIVGSPRSGTTLLYHLLLSAGGFAIYRGETHAFNLLAPRFSRLERRADREVLADFWLNSEFFRRSGLNEAPLRRRIVDECRNEGDFLRLVMNSVAASQGAERWAESTPDTAFSLSRVRRFFPDAKVIHIVRDGRDAALSIAKAQMARPLPYDRSGPVEVAAVFWEDYVRAARRDGPAFGDNFCEIRFADLISDRAGTLQRLAVFLERPFDLDRIARVAIGAVGAPNSSFDSKDGFNPLDRWRSLYDQNQLRRVEQLIGATLRELGFELSTPLAERRPPFSIAVRRGAYRATFHLKRRLKEFRAMSRLISIGLLQGSWGEDEAWDRTLRPGENRDLIRRIVPLELPPDFTRSELFHEAARARAASAGR